MPELLFSPAPPVSVPIVGSSARFPVHRIYCVGRNYADHAREMGKDPAREPPFFFTKPADAIVEDGAAIPYPPRTKNLHHEVELVVALGAGGRNIAVDEAGAHVYGYAVGNDYTRRDLQLAARDLGRPWDVGKAFDCSAALGPIHPVDQVGHVARGAIWLAVNDEPRQRADLRDMIWDVPAIVAELSALFELRPGDLIYTGTPAGVGPVCVGDCVTAGIEGLGRLQNRIVAPA
jgi:fumarylpyruvate hydrolase